MIVSASRRTDLPAYHAAWFMSCVRAGFCEVPNPFNPAQVSRVSLAPADVELIVFWTRNAEPLRPSLADLTDRGLRFLFLYTLLGYGPPLEPHAPPLAVALDRFRALSDAVGPDRIVWRYDPIILTDATGVAFHSETFARLCRALQGHTRRCVLSFVDLYRGVGRRLAALSGAIGPVQAPSPDRLDALMPGMVAAAAAAGIALQTCAEKVALAAYGIAPGACIDADYIRSALGIGVSPRKDPAQRPLCRCALSRDIGTYNTCPHGCAYCYATTRPSPRP